MNRIDRLLGIVTALQSKKHMTAEQMAEQFGTSVRTVFRDLRAMGEIGVPIGFQAGKGYFITDGYFLPPVTLTMEEANSLALIVPLVERFADKSARRHFASALSKIKMVLGKKQRKTFEHLQAQTAHFIPEMYVHMLQDTSYLTSIQNAIVQKTIVRIEYENTNGERSTREVEPIGLTFYSLNWHLIAWCHQRRDYRDFRTSRIQNLTVTLMPFRINDHIGLREYLSIMEKTLVQETS